MPLPGHTQVVITTNVGDEPGPPDKVIRTMEWLREKEPVSAAFIEEKKADKVEITSYAHVASQTYEVIEAAF